MNLFTLALILYILTLSSVTLLSFIRQYKSKKHKE